MTMDQDAATAYEVELAHADAHFSRDERCRDCRWWFHDEAVMLRGCGVCVWDREEPLMVRGEDDATMCDFFEPRPRQMDGSDAEDELWRAESRFRGRA